MLGECNRDSLRELRIGRRRREKKQSKKEKSNDQETNIKGRKATLYFEFR